MIAREDDAGGIREARALEALQHAAHQVVQERAEPEVRGDGDAPFIIVEKAVRRHVSAVRLYPRMRRAAVERVGFGHGHGVCRVHVEILLRRHQGEMRRNEGDEGHPGFPGAAMFFRLVLQPRAGVPGDVQVVVRIARLAGAYLARELVRLLDDQLIADGSHRAAHPAARVHGNDLLVEAGGVGRVFEVQLADRGNAVTLGLQAMPPALRLARIGARVVPTADLVHVAARGEARPGGNADRRIRVGARKPRARGRQAVDVRRLHHLVAIAAERLDAEFIRHDDEQIHRFHCKVSLILW